jgi:hypothetical protein
VEWRFQSLKQKEIFKNGSMEEKTDDALKIIHRKFYDGKPERLEELDSAKKANSQSEKLGDLPTDQTTKNPILLVSFWDVGLDNLPIGTIHHSIISPETAREEVLKTRNQGKVICVSQEDLSAPYKKDSLEKYKHLCTILQEEFNIKIAIKEFFSEIKDESGDRLFLHSNPLDLYRIGENQQLLVVSCSFTNFSLNRNDGITCEVAKDSVSFHLFKSLPIEY